MLILIAGSISRGQEAEQVGTEIKIELLNGDILTGTLRELTTDELVLDHPYAGLIRIHRASIKPAQAPAVVVPVSPWSGTFDISITGKRGNTQEQDARLDFTARRETDRTIDSYIVNFQQSSAEVDGQTDQTARRGFAQGRREWRLEDSKWRPFLQGSVEDDKFKDWNQRVRIAAGGAYPWIENDEERFIGRIGAGGEKQFGGEDDDWTPEALLGVDYFLLVREGQSINLSTEVYPSLDDMGEYQSITRAEYRVVVSPEDPWSLKVGFEHLHDSDPGPGDKSGDWTYYLGAGYVF